MRYLILAGSVCLAACSPAAPVEEGETLQAELTSPVETAVETAAEVAQAAAPVLDPTALDFSRIALAMRIPAAFEAREDGAYLQINVTNERLGVNVSEEFPLVQTSEVTSPFCPQKRERDSGYGPMVRAPRMVPCSRRSAESLPA